MKCIAAHEPDADGLPGVDRRGKRKDDKTHQICKERVCEGGEHDGSLREALFSSLVLRRESFCTYVRGGRSPLSLYSASTMAAPISDLLLR